MRLQSKLTMDLDLSNFDTRKTRPYSAGIMGLPSDVERYIAKAQGLTGFELFKGDIVTINNIEGGQLAEVVVFNSDGQCSPEVVSSKSNGDASFTKNVLSHSPDNKFLLNKLKKKNINFHNSISINLFDSKTKAGECSELLCQEDGLIIISSPGDDMSVDQQNPATDLEIKVKRKNKTNNKANYFLPPPLADMKEEFIIGNSTAISYEVEAGDFIQVIDLYGRQCSDFQVFDAGKLQKGKELNIDPIATRSIIGLNYAMPGLFAKYFDRDQDALIEVIQDTCGRHDTFGNACSSKYYEDVGYFGHVNCSDNFNETLKPFGIEERRAWQAINLFFNTALDANNVLFFDIPWSSPGNYVLFQAQKNLVCASSACPCDIDPANNWNPTDICVRIYSKENFFSKAMGYRKNTDSDVSLTKQTGFHQCTSKLTNDYVEFAGIWIPNKYDNYGTVAEYDACRNNVVMMDLSSLKKYEIIGPDAEELMNTALTRNVKKLAIGQVVYTAMCYENGTMIDDGTLFKLGDANFRWICGNDYSGEWIRDLAKKLDLNASVKSSTDQLHNISVQGPNSRKVLSKIMWTTPASPGIEDLKWFHFSISRLNDHLGIPVMLSRTGYTGELGYEVYCHPKDAPKVWDAIWEAGKEFDIAPMGFGALDMLRIEAGLILGGNEFSDETDPFEAGISFTVPLKSKDANFIGRDALIKRKESPHRKLVGLEIEGNDKCGNGDCVHIGRGQVGVVTSGMISPILNKNIALCRIDIHSSEEGTEVEIGKLDGHQKRIKAKIVPFPFYDPTKSRVKA